MTSERKQLSCGDYRVAWICAVANLEQLPARLMLDEEHTTPQYDTHYDDNAYICGSISGHAVVIATCPQGKTGNVHSGRLTLPLYKTFRNISITVLVGIGGGIPSPVVSSNPRNNIHLGDVVVGWPGDGKPACIYHDSGRLKAGEPFEMVGTLQGPNWATLTALGILETDYRLGKTTFDDQLARLRHNGTGEDFNYPGFENDMLFNPAYRHIGGYSSRCMTCKPSEIIERPHRNAEDQGAIVFHQGRIATGNSVIQDGTERDEISARCGGALCVEMEAAGVSVNGPCLVIRGISDYADSHKSDLWRVHAAGKAAAFARELLCRVQPAQPAPPAQSTSQHLQQTAVAKETDAVTEGQ